MKNLLNCNKPHEIHYEFIRIFISHLSDKEQQPMQETFQSIDTDNSGQVSLDELIEVYQKLVQYGEVEEVQDIAEVMNKLDYDHSGHIALSEFIALTLTLKELSFDNIKKFFNAIVPIEQTTARGTESTNADETNAKLENMKMLKSKSVDEKYENDNK